MDLPLHVAYGVLEVVPVYLGLNAIFRLITAIEDSLLCVPIELFISAVSGFGQQQLVYYGAVVSMNLLFAIYSHNFPVPKGESFYETPSHKLESTYDFIIAGGGSAGCLLANRLSADPRFKVLLIEGGGVPNILSQVPTIIHMNQNNRYSHLDWRYFSVPQKIGFQRVHANSNNHKRSHMGAGKGLGGSSHINAQMYSRAHKADFDRWKEVYGAEGWGAEDVWPFMKSYEKQLDPKLHTKDHGVNGELEVSTAPMEHNRPLVESFIAAGAKATGTKAYVDYNDGESNGFARLQSTINADGFSSHSARSFIDPVRKSRHNLHIILHTMVSRVIFEGTNAIGVEVEPEGVSRVLPFSHRKFYARREVILSAGPARSPQILLLSGVGPKYELDKFNIRQVAEAPVGENLHDHPWILGMNIIYPHGKGFCEISADELRRFFNKKTSFFRAPDAIEAIGFYSSNFSKDGRPDIEIFLDEVSANREEIHVYLSAMGISERDFYSYFSPITQPFNARGAFLIPVMLHSPTRGRVRLQSTKIADHPIFDIQYLSSDYDIPLLVEALRMTKKIAQEMILGLNRPAMFTERTVPGCEEFAGDKDSYEYLECHIKAYTASIWHMSGTCAIGSGPKSVVDPQLKVRGTTNLRVIDASIFPEPVSGHMVATVYAVAEKGAQLILEEHRPERSRRRYSDNFIRT